MAAVFKTIFGVRVIRCNLRHKIRSAYAKFGPPPAGEESVNLIFLSGGGLVFRFAEQSVTVRAGEVLVWEDPAALEMTALPDKPVSYWFFSFVPLGAGGRVPLEATGLSRVCRPLNPGVFLKHLVALNRLLIDKPAGWEQSCAIRALGLLLELAPESRVTAVPSGPDDRLTERRIGDVLNYINANFKKRLGIGQLARIAKMHPAHLNRLFKKATGTTPHRYILEKKVGKARDFLLYYGESLTTTALELGFHDYSHFTRVFRKLAGATPREFLEKSGARKSVHH
jgi:AraC-like DNA-binding protein